MGLCLQKPRPSGDHLVYPSSYIESTKSCSIMTLLVQKFNGNLLQIVYIYIILLIASLKIQQALQTGNRLSLTFTEQYRIYFLYVIFATILRRFSKLNTSYFQIFLFLQLFILQLTDTMILTIPGQILVILSLLNLGQSSTKATASLSQNQSMSSLNILHNSHQLTFQVLNSNPSQQVSKRLLTQKQAQTSSQFVSGQNQSQNFQQQNSASTKLKLINQFKQFRKSLLPINMTYKTYLRLYKPEKFQQFRNNRKFKNPNQAFMFYQQIYKSNINRINEFNKNNENTYVMGLNKFSDLDQKQFKSIYTFPLLYQRLVISFRKYNPEVQIIRTTRITQFFSDFTTNNRLLQSLPTNSRSNELAIDIDWSDFSNSVKDQGKCNSCYAFSALDTIQINLRINKDSRAGQLSAQQILSCGLEQDFVLGCAGGTVADSYAYMKFNNGVGYSKDYPYELNTYYDGINFECSQIVQNPRYIDRKFYLRSYRRIEYNNCNQLIYILSSKQVVSAAISSQGLQLYSNGTYTPQKSKRVTNEQLNHQVTVIGYYHQNVYKVKNSWGTSWGIGGYAYMTSQVGICMFGIQSIIDYQ